jgi:hypothetical protein
MLWKAWIPAFAHVRPFNGFFDWRQGFAGLFPSFRHALGRNPGPYQFYFVTFQHGITFSHPIPLPTSPLKGEEASISLLFKGGRCNSPPLQGEGQGGDGLPP